MSIVMDLSWRRIILKGLLYKGDSLCVLCKSLTYAWVAEYHSGGNYSFFADSCKGGFSNRGTLESIDLRIPGVVKVNP